jgi:hypothetical protein
VSQTLGYDFPFVVNAPAGATVLVATVRHGEGQPSTFVHDLPAKTVYCGAALREVLAGHTTSITDPLAVLARSGWTLVESTKGIVIGAIVAQIVPAFDHRGHTSHLTTQLYVEVFDSTCR